jgi:hypothetical protein
MMSKSVVFTPATNANYPDGGNLKYTSWFHGFTAWQMINSINFRVSAKTGTSAGIYYIDWSTTEVLQPGVTTNRYIAPVSILVEVGCNGGETTTTITVAAIPSLYKGYNSIPISITLEQAPASDVTVSMAFGSTSSGISVNPASITFGPDHATAYFQVIVSSSYDNTQTAPQLSFTLSGSDIKSYTAPVTKAITVLSTTASATAAAITTLSYSLLTGSDVAITVVSNQNAILYWGLACSGTDSPTFEQLVASTAGLVSQANGTYTLMQQLQMQYMHTETDPNPALDIDVYAFFRRQQRQHCATVWTSAMSVYAGVSYTITLDWLFAQTPYIFSAYVDNLLINDTTGYIVDNKTFTAGPSTGLPTVYTQSVTFSGAVATSSGDNIRYAIAKNMGINPAWLAGQAVTTTTSRMLQTGTTMFTYNVLYDRSNPLYSSSVIAANLARTQVQTDLTTLVGVAPTIGASTAVTTGSSPTWVSAPQSSSVAETTATFIATDTQAGLICVECSIYAGTKTTYAWQVLAGLDAQSDIAYGTCGNSTASTNTTLTVTGLSTGTTYHCYFTGCNNYPLWPSCIDATVSTNLASVSITTLTPAVVSSSVYMTLVAAFLLIFN